MVLIEATQAGWSLEKLKYYDTMGFDLNAYQSCLGRGHLFQPSPSPPPGIPGKSEYKYKCTKNINQWEKVHKNQYLRHQ